MNIKDPDDLTTLARVVEKVTPEFQASLPVFGSPFQADEMALGYVIGLYALAPEDASELRHRVIELRRERAEAAQRRRLEEIQATQDRLLTSHPRR